MNSRGTRRERQVRQHLEADGWLVVRAAGSLGTGDLVAGKRGFPTRLVEVKANTVSPWKTFTPKERQEMAQAAYQAGWEAWLVWWPPNQGITWYHEAVWPNHTVMQDDIMEEDI